MAVANGTTKLQSRAAPEQRAARQTLLELFGRCPIPREQLLVNLGLYTRSSVLAKMLYVNELYQQIVRVPGVVMEFGVWWGTNLALFESLRAIYEPYNHTRKVIGFVLTARGYFKLRYPGSVSTMAYGIDQNGNIVGQYLDPSGVTHGFVRTR